MTEREKRDQGVLYDANYDLRLKAERDRAKELCFALNQLPPSRAAEKDRLLRELLGAAGEQFEIVTPFWCDYGYHITLGERFFSNHNLVILDCAAVTFGTDVFVGPNCGFYTAGHPVDFSRRDQGLEYAWPITVGSHVWFGGGVQVMPGVTIGSNVVIGSGSVVTRDIPDGCVAAGSPCRVIRPITERDEMRVYRWEKT